MKHETGLPQEQLVQRMKSSGLRLTKARIAMAALIAIWQRPFTSTEVIDDLKRSGMGIHRATVFRDLEAMVRTGLLREVQVAGERGRHFVLAHDRSGHFLVCELCGKMMPINRGEIMPVLKQWEGLAPEANGWQIRVHEVESYGTCPDCLAKR